MGPAPQGEGGVKSKFPPMLSQATGVKRRRPQKKVLWEKTSGFSFIPNLGRYAKG